MTSVGVRELKGRLSHYLRRVKVGERLTITERGKILPRRISGNCAKHQRELTAAIKRARNIALMPFSVLST